MRRRANRTPDVKGLTPFGRNLDNTIGGDATFTRATVATVEDHEGVIRSVLSGEVRYQGQRRVENLAGASEDLTDAAWGADSTANATEAAATIELTGVDSSYHYKRITPTGDISGNKFVMTADVTWISGTTTVLVRTNNTGTAAIDSADIDLSDLTTKRVSLNITAGSDGDILFGIDNRTAAGASDTAVTKVTFTNIQIQDKSGASDPTTPDSYISTGVLSAPYHGANVDGVLYSLTDNSGNSVTDNILTESAGIPITGAIGYFGEVARTNKCTNYNANPPDSTNINVGTNLTVTQVTDATELAAAGLDGVTGIVHKVVSTDGVATRRITISGPTTNTNTHSAKVFLRVESGSTAFMADSFDATQLGATITETSYQEVVANGFIPAATTTTIAIYLDALGTCYFILNQLEEGSFATSEIITEGAAATRNKDELSYPTTLIPVNDCVFTFDWTPTAAGQGTAVHFGSGDATNHITSLISGTTLTFRKNLSGVAYTATRVLSYVVGTTYTLKCRLDSTNGVDVWIDDVKGAGDSDINDASFGSTINIGSYFGGTFQQTGGIAKFKVHQGSFSDAEVVAL